MLRLEEVETKWKQANENTVSYLWLKHENMYIFV